jgi:transcriptional regulator with XRE-family HTH domain
MNELVQELVDLRKKKAKESSGFRQVDVAKAMGVGQPSVSEFEKGKTNPRLDTIQRYAEAIGVRIELKVVNDGNE